MSIQAFRLSDAIGAGNNKKGLCDGEVSGLFLTMIYPACSVLSLSASVVPFAMWLKVPNRQARKDNSSVYHHLKRH